METWRNNFLVLHEWKSLALKEKAVIQINNTYGCSVEFRAILPMISRGKKKKKRKNKDLLALPFLRNINSVPDWSAEILEQFQTHNWVEKDWSSLGLKRDYTVATMVTSEYLFLTLFYYVERRNLPLVPL